MIEFDNVSFKYKGRVSGNAINHVSFHIDSGEMILICGESGCGKSTITRIINGLIPHFYKGELDGKVRIDSVDTKGKTLYEINEKIGSVFQNPRTQFFNLDSDGELVFGCENRGYPLDEILKNREKSIQLFNMQQFMHRNIYNLSGGQQQKLACASTYCTNPDIFVLDEPTSNLDEQSIEDLKQNLASIKKEGKTVVIAEHRLYFLMDLVDRIFYMKNGILEHIYSREEFKRLSVEMLSAMGLRSTVKTKIQPELLKKVHEPHRECCEIKNAQIIYKDNQSKEKRIIKIDDLNIPLGEIAAIVGKNGIGKTSFAKTVAGLQKKSTVDVYLHGKKLSKKDQIKKCFLVMQDVNHQLFTDSIIEEIKLGAQNLNVEKAKDLLKIFELFDLKNEHPMDLSGGQKQRVVIAAAISSGKKIVLLDEPTSGLDYHQMKNVSKALKELQKKVDLIIVVTHDLEFINSCCTMIIPLSTKQEVR